MKIMIKHVFNLEEGSPVKLNLTEETTIAKLGKGEWIGVVQEEGDYFEVLTKKGYGWIKKDACAMSQDLSFGIRQNSFYTTEVLAA